MTYEEAGVRFCAVSACGGRGPNENTGLNPELLRQKVVSCRYMGANENFVPVVVKSSGAPCLAF